MEAGSDKGGLEQIGTWGNEYLGLMDIWGNECLGKIYIWGNWAPVEMGTGANKHQGTDANMTYGEKEYPKCPVSIFPKCLRMGTGANGHLKQMDIWGKGTTQVPYVHFPQMYANGHWGKWALGVNANLGERGTPSALCPFIPNFYKWALGQMDAWGKGHPKYPVPISPKFFKRAVEKMDLGDPSAHLPQCPFCPSAHLGDMGTGHLDYPFTQLSICPVSICKNLGE